MLLGGHDVDPALYGEEPHETTEGVSAPRDEYEIALVKAAIARDLPIFAICRGIQLLNVALGGSLVQDIPTQVLQHLDHHPGGAPSMIGHYVEVTPGTQLAGLVEAELERDGFCAVNSRHHQALKKVGDGLKVTASSVDGVIEAVERPASRFCVARAVAPRELLAERPLPGPVPRLPGRGAGDALNDSGVEFNSGVIVTDAPARPASRRAPCSGRDRSPRATRPRSRTRRAP